MTKTERTLIDFLKHTRDLDADALADTSAPEGFGSEAIDLLASHRSTRTEDTGALGPEAKLLGSSLPLWVRPLHFEDNLSAALDALESCEGLLATEQSLTLAKMEQHYALATMPTDSHPTYNSHIDSLDMDGFAANLRLRLLARYLDAVEYTKAARLGKRIVFESHESPLFPTEAEEAPSFKDLNALRESLRTLLIEYRLLKSNTQEIVMPISLKWATEDGGPALKTDDYVVQPWPVRAGDSRVPTCGLGHRSLSFDLTDYKPLEAFKKAAARLIRIGVRVVDEKSRTAWSSNNTEKDWMPPIWNLSVRDAGSGVPLGGRARHLIHPIRFNDVEGSESGITWSRYDAVHNLNPDRSWVLKIEEPRCHSRADDYGKVTEIRDIVIFMHIAFQADKVTESEDD